MEKISPGNKRIFVVDDDESVCRALKFILLTHDFHVETFDSAEKFFSAVPNSILGCLILDIHMPGLEGWQAQRRLSKSGSTRPVIIISADKSEGLKNLTLQAGAVGFLQKPFSDAELIDLVNSAFDDQGAMTRIG